MHHTIPTCKTVPAKQCATRTAQTVRYYWTCLRSDLPVILPQSYDMLYYITFTMLRYYAIIYKLCVPCVYYIVLRCVYYTVEQYAILNNIVYLLNIYCIYG